MKYKHSDLSIPKDTPFANCRLNRKPNAVVLTQIVKNYADGFVLSVNGAWGTGKSTFVKMWVAYLEQQGIRSIYFNAWENDFISDPMVALLGELQQLKTTETVKTLNSILDIGSKIAVKAIPALTKGIVKHYCGEAVAEAAKDVLEVGAEIFKTEVIEYENKRNKLITFKKELSDFIEEAVPNKPLVFIVDELDRCRPDYAVEILERIKHFFSIKGIVFVLSIDKAQLCNAIRGHYGSDLIDAEEYLRRFIDVEYLLPEPDVESYCKYLYEYFGFQLFLEDIRRQSPYSELRDDPDRFLKCAKEIARAKNLSLRQIEKLFVHARLVLSSCTCNHYIFPQSMLMLVYIRSVDPQFYFQITRKQLSAQDIADRIPQIFPTEMFQEPTRYAQKAALWGLAEMFYCYAQSFERTGRPLEIISDEQTLAFDIDYVDNTRLAEAISYYHKRYRGAYWSHIVNAIDLLNPIVEAE